MDEARKEIDIAAAREVVLQVYGDLVLRQGGVPALHVEGDPDLVAKARAESRGDKLELTLGRDWVERLASGFAMLGNRPLRYVLTLPAPERLEVAGRGRLQVQDVTLPRFALRVTGLAEGSLHGLDVEEFGVEVAGRGELTFSGRASRQRVRVSGSGQLSAFGLESDQANVRIGGHGDVEVSVRDSLEVRIAGYGQVTYQGDPQVHQTVSGGGGVQRRGAGTDQKE